MKLRNGKIINPVDYRIESLQSDFINLFYSIKNTYKYHHFYNHPTFTTKYTLCNLYAAFKTFINKEFEEPYWFLYHLSNNTLLPYTDLSPLENCYICRTNDSKPAISCCNNHFIHIECFFEQILFHIRPVYTAFVIPNDPLRCDYCSSKFLLNTEPE